MLLAGSVLAAGCAAQPDRPDTRPAAPVARAGAVPRSHVTVSGQASGSSDPKSQLRLDQIEPPVAFPATAPTTEPALPPIEAVRLFAQARAAQLDGQTFAAADLLRQAIALDPGSFDLHRSLAELYDDGSDPRALAEWEKVARIEPDRLDVQMQLARQQIMRGDFAAALTHLRLATRTSDYKQDAPASGEADFLLARVLQEQGYDRAALEVYERLLVRLTNPSYAMRRVPQLSMLLLHPEALSLRIASLYEKHGEWAPALKILRAAAVREGTGFEVQARIVRDMAASGDKPAAVRAAADLVARSHGDRDSVALLRQLIGPDGAVQTLEQLRRRQPDDRQVVYALVDLLTDEHRPAEATRTIEQGMQRWPEDLPLLRRRVALLASTGKLDDAGKLLIASFAHRPDRELELLPLWRTLTRPSASGWLRLRDVQKLSVSPDLQPARLVLLAQEARTWRRDAIEHDSLRKAVAARPVFGPAFREMLAWIWSDPLRSDQQKSYDARELIDSARQAGDGGLADELRAQSLLDQHKPSDAAMAFADAVKSGDRSPELYLNFAAAVDATGNLAGAQKLLWKLALDRPFCAEAYIELYALCEKDSKPQEARRVLSAWLTADPGSVVAARAAAREAFAARRFSDAERILLDLFEHHDNDPDVLAALQEFYTQTNQLPELMTRLKERLAREPWNFTLAEALAQTYADRQRTSDAVGVIGRMRRAFGDDPDLLYEISGLYARAGQNAASEQVLRQVLKLDPSDAGASNDLAYTWAEQGKNLGEAEALVRQAVNAEPDNLSFLDSMGWVLYKRGKFAEALPHLAKAAQPDGQADPVVLDHLGDTLYRLGDREQAARRWQQAVSRIGQSRDDATSELKELRAQLLKKRQQLEARQPVSVAPVAQEH